MTSRLKATQRFFDAYWQHERIRRLDSIGLFARSATKKAYALMGGLEGKRVLEVGPGEGLDLKDMSELGAHVFGVDVSSRSLDLSRQICSQSDLFKMDGERLGFHDSVFDFIFSRTLLMHVDRAVFLKECVRVLKPDGKAIFIEPLKYNPLLLPYRAAFSSGRFIKPDYLRPEETEKMKRVFSSVRVWYYYFVSALGGPLASIAPWSKILFYPLETIDRALLSVLPPLKNLCWISVIECTK